jgi:cytoskeletal protein CcmA (bactofilin family)
MAIWDRRPGRLPAPAPPPPRPAEPAPAFLTPPPQVRAMLDRESTVSGKLSFAGPTRIDGTLRGEVRASDLLIIGETGSLDGTVRAVSLLVLGRVDGQVLGAERVEVGPQGRLSGSVETEVLVVRDGGQIDADCRVALARGENIHQLRPRAE